MKKSVMIAASAIAFDLGVMVVAAHAAPSGDWLPIKNQDTSQQAKFQDFHFVRDGQKTGKVANAEACKAANGKVEVHSYSWGASQSVCILPGKTVAK